MTTKLAACEPVPPVFQIRVSTGAITVNPTEHCALLPAASVTVTVMRYEPGPTTVPAGGDCEQLSAATGVQSSLKQFLLQKSGMIALHARIGRVSCCRQAQSITGGVVSPRRITLKLHVAELPIASVAVQVTVLVPTGKLEPDGGVHTTVTGEPQLLLAWAFG